MMKENSTDGGDKLFESQEQPQSTENPPDSDEESSSYISVYEEGFSENDYDSEDREQDERIETDDGENVFGNDNSNMVVEDSIDGGGELFQSQKLPQPTEIHQNSEEICSYINSASQFVVYVSNLEKLHWRLIDEITAKDAANQKLNNDWLAAVEMNKQMKI